MNIHCDIRPITNITNTKSLKAVIDNTSCWKNHIDQIMPKLNAVGLAITVVKPLVSQDNWKMVYYSYYHTMKIIEEYFGKNSA